MPASIPTKLRGNRLRRIGVAQTGSAPINRQLQAAGNPAARNILAPWKRKGRGAHHKTGQLPPRATLRFARAAQQARLFREPEPSSFGSLGEDASHRASSLFFTRGKFGPRDVFLDYAFTQKSFAPMRISKRPHQSDERVKGKSNESTSLATNFFGAVCANSRH
jgi:hypothetical protein